MLIMSLNVNDFGGKYSHLEEYKSTFGRDYLQEWDRVDKKEFVSHTLELVQVKKPDIIAIQEFDIRSEAGKAFIDGMENLGYVIESEKPTTARPSMTVLFIQGTLVYTKLKSPHDRNLRACVVKIDDYVILGEHVPPKYDKNYWDELTKFFHDNDKVILIGDLNTINDNNLQRYKQLLENNVTDAWSIAGKDEDGTTTDGAGRLDYILLSSTIPQDHIETIEIIRTPLDMDFSDHAALAAVIDI